MSIYNWAGWFVLSMPFLVIFICVAKKDGLKVAAALFFSVAALVAIINLGVYLTKI